MRETEDIRRRIMDTTFDIVEGGVIDRGALADLLIEVDKQLVRFVNLTSPETIEALSASWKEIIDWLEMHGGAGSLPVSKLNAISILNHHFAVLRSVEEATQ